MHHHFLFIEKLSVALHNQIVGSQLVECFSQNRDELILTFEKDPETYFSIKADLRPEVSLLSFPSEFARAKKNSVDLFSSLLDIVVISVEPFPFDRSFRINFENKETLVFKLYGRRSNILLFRPDNESELFRSELGQDESLTLADFTTNKELLQVQDPEKTQSILGHGLFNHLINKGLISLNKESLAYMRALPIHITSKPKLSLSFILETDSQSEEFSDPIEAANRFYYLFTGTVLFEKERFKLAQSINQRIKQAHNYVKKSGQKLEELINRRSNREIADIIMANLHLFEEGKTEQELFDFYKNQTITIKLRPNTTPQKHAENLYRKAKNEKIEFEKLESNITNKEAQLQDLLKLKSDLDQASTWKELKPFFSESKADNQAKEHLPYAVYQKEGYEIRVGKDAKRNDQLTTKFSSKDDIWLHAKDVPGSHVVIRNPTKQKVPKPVLEYAAGIAAYFSKRKQDQLCPVLYTERKYVRKAKRLLPGQVIVDREEVLLVPPLNPSK